MANILVHRIEFVQNNPYGDFVAGDVLEVYIDDTAIVVPATFGGDGLSVTLNGTPYAGSGSILDFSPSIVSIQSYNVHICVGTYLIQFFSFALNPYAYYSSFENHYSCVVNPPTCNLTIVSTPNITPATDETTADGVIAISATSTNTIEYNLGSDFVYGEGQASGTFADLLPGDYRIFLRDSANCAANILVNVPFGNTYAPIYRLEYDGSLAFSSKIEVTRKGYSGSVSEVKGQSMPFEIQLRGEGETDKFKALLSSQANLNLTSETDGFFADLYTNNPNLFRISFYKDFGSGYELLWTGKVLPFIYSETIKSPPYEVTVTASDGLPELKDLYLVQKDGQKYFGTEKLIKIVAFCLKQIGLNLNIKVACNMYADGMDTTDADDPFDQAYIDYECFYLADKEPSLEFVLKSILEPFNARIIQWENVWNIVRVEELTGAYDYREFDYLGDYVSESSYNPIKEINYPSSQGLMWEAFPNLEIQKGFGQIKVFYKLGLKPNIINNGDFRLQSTYNPDMNNYSFDVNTTGFALVNAGYTLTTGYEKIDEGNIAYIISGIGEQMLVDEDAGEAYVQTDTFTVKMGVNNQIKINIRYKINKTIKPTTVASYSVDAPYVKLRVRVKYGSYYLQSDGSWNSTENILVFFVTTLSEYVESEIVANYPIVDGVVQGTPNAGMDFEIRVYHAYVFHAQFHSVTDLEAFPTYSGGDDLIPTGFRTELRDSFASLAYFYYYTLEENTSLPSGYDIIRPDDYHGTNNPRQWILKTTYWISPFLTGVNLFSLAIDRIKATFLINGNDAYDTIVRIANAEPLNKDTLEKELIIGSFSNLVTTEVIFNFIDLGLLFPNPTPGLTLTTTNVLSADLIYTGWLRDSSGDGYEFWTRDGIAELDKLHAIWLKSYTAQYHRSWRLIRGASVSETEYFGLLNVIKDVNDNDRIYVPISLTLDDFNNRASGEYLELMPVTGGSDGGGSSPFSSGFSSGFGASGFN